MLDITRCLTLSTSHISEDVAKKLKNEAITFQNNLALVVYEKRDYGFWIYCPQDMIRHFNGGKDIPEDLWNCMLLAYEHNCNWLCLDRDGEEVENLQKYNW